MKCSSSLQAKGPAARPKPGAKLTLAQAQAQAQALGARAQARAQAGPKLGPSSAQARFLEIWKSWTWKSWNLDSPKNKNRENGEYTQKSASRLRPRGQNEGGPHRMVILRPQGVQGTIKLTSIYPHSNMTTLKLIRYRPLAFED